MAFDKKVAASTAAGSHEESKNGPNDSRDKAKPLLHMPSTISARMSIRRPEEVKFRSKDETRAAEALKEEVEGD